MNTRNATHMVVARMGSREAGCVEIVSTRKTCCGPFSFQRIPNQGEVGIVRFQLEFEGRSINMVIRYGEGSQIMIPIGEAVWVLHTVPGRSHAKDKAERWNGEYFDAFPDRWAGGIDR